ncbi:MAG: MBL fold metallo-hydrolase [Clostridia bacterium]|nr:MBL fold metallo-hydrolase [Clostridia bacterium]
MRFEPIEKGIFLLKVPFEDLYTSVFAVIEEDRIALIDTATTDFDVDTYIVPALQELIDREGGRLCYILLTHGHGDHAGGAIRLSGHFPNVPICALQSMEYSCFHKLSDGEEIMDRLQVVHLPGHTVYAVGYLDLKHRLLLSGDCLQLRGVGKYTRGVSDKEAYFSSIERLKTMEIEIIVASHDYVPLGSTAKGKEAVAKYLETCKKVIE